MNTSSLTSAHPLRLHEWLDTQVARGRYSFSWEELVLAMPDQSPEAIRSALSRQIQKGFLVSVHRGYYVILTPPYRKQGILPPYLFLDALMQYLHRSYYLGLLSAAALHGAAHRQPQVFFVVTEPPSMRPTRKAELEVNYLVNSKLLMDLVEKRKTESGFIHVSNPVLTACDLVTYAPKAGGLVRVAEVLSELSEAISATSFPSVLVRHMPKTTLQRLGFLLETVCEQPDLSDALYRAIQNEHIRFFRTPLDTEIPMGGLEKHPRWKVVENRKIEVEL